MSGPLPRRASAHSAETAGDGPREDNLYLVGQETRRNVNVVGLSR